MRSLAIATVSALTLSVHAQTPDLTVNNFDIEDEVFSWARWWGGPVQLYEFDASMDANNSAASGSLRATIDFDVATYAGDNQFALVGAFPENATLDGSQYSNLVFDLRWDPSSPMREGGDFGFLEIGFRRADFTQLSLTPITVPATAADGWMRVTVPITPAAAGIDQITGIFFKLWSGDPITGFTGTTTFWIDNVYLEGRTDTTIPEPTLSLQQTDPGLRIYASGTSQYQRQNIRTVDPSQSWVGAPSPVTYAFTIGDFPAATNYNFQTHLFLVPGFGIASFEISPDYNQPHVVFLDIQNTEAGTAVATFRHKTNAPGSNTMIYNSDPESGPVGALASISVDDIRGTWSLTFANDTDVTLTAPGGTSTNFTLSAETAALFADPLYVYLGIQPNRLENLGQSALFTSFSSTGTSIPITETFEGIVMDPETAPNLDPAIWERVAENAAGILLIPADSDYLAEWTVPAIGFQLQRTESLTNPEWIDVTADATQVGDRVRAALPATGDQGFYRLVKPAAQ